MDCPLQAARAATIAQTKTGLIAVPPGPDADGTAALPLSAYAETYEDPGYGPMTGSGSGSGALAISFDRTPGMTGILEAVGGNRFRTCWTDRPIGDAYVTFAVVDGKVGAPTMKAVSPLAGFSFDYQDLGFSRIAD